VTTLEALDAKLDAIAATLERLERQVPAAPADQPELLTPRAAAAALSVSTKTIQRMVRDGRLRTVQVGRHWRVPLAEVRRYSTPKAAAPRPHRQRRAAEPYDARAEYEKGMKRLGGRR